MSNEKHHVVPVRTYLAVFAGLIILLALTVTAAFFDFGPLDLAVTITIAVAKAMLILAYFMHLRYSNSLVWIFAGMGFFWIIIMLLLTMGDYLARGTIVGPLGS